MLHEHEIAAFIEGSFPELEKIDEPGKLNSTEVHKAMAGLSGYLKRKFRANDMVAVKEIFRVAETIYRKGDAAVRNSIENVFIYSLTAIMPNDSGARKELKAMIPARIFSTYINQVYCSSL